MKGFDGHGFHRIGGDEIPELQSLPLIAGTAFRLVALFDRWMHGGASPMDGADQHALRGHSRRRLAGSEPR